MNRPGYRVQSGCHDCHHAFEWYDYDEETKYYCTVGAGPRPLCMSVAMNEYPDSEDIADLRDAEEQWMSWGKECLVVACGICDNWKLYEWPSEEMGVGLK